MGVKVAAESLEWYSHGGDVLAGEGIGGVADQQTGLTHSPEEDEGAREGGREEGEQTTSSAKKEGFVFRSRLKVCLCVVSVRG